MYSLHILIHEMKHVEQFASGRLGRKWIWGGEIYKDVAYKDLPWEIEAYAFEDKLLNVIMEQVKDV